MAPRTFVEYVDHNPRVLSREHEFQDDCIPI